MDEIADMGGVAARPAADPTAGLVASVRLVQSSPAWSLASARVVAFVGVADLDRAAAFYGDTLGLPLRDESPLALVAEAGDTTVRFTATEAVHPAPYTVLGWRVDDVVAAVDALRARGVTFAQYPGVSQDERGVWLAPGGARVAWFRDPDGNLLSLTQDA